MSGIASFLMSAWEQSRNKKIESRAFFIIGVICLVIAFDQAWQDEHRNSEILTAEKSVLSSESSFWKGQSYSKDEALRSRDQLLGQNYAVLAANQLSLSELSNRLLDITGPAPRKIDVMAWKIPITYTFANLSCDADVTIITENVLTHASSLRADYDVISPREVHIEFLYPPVSAENPLMFFASTKEGVDIHTCTFKLD
jgi:hypothetical protein